MPSSVSRGFAQRVVPQITKSPTAAVKASQQYSGSTLKATIAQIRDFFLKLVGQPREREKTLETIQFANSLLPKLPTSLNTQAHVSRRVIIYDGDDCRLSLKEEGNGSGSILMQDKNGIGGFSETLLTFSGENEYDSFLGTLIFLASNGELDVKRMREEAIEAYKASVNGLPITKGDKFEIFKKLENKLSEDKLSGNKLSGDDLVTYANEIPFSEAEIKIETSINKGRIVSICHEGKELHLLSPGVSPQEIIETLNEAKASSKYPTFGDLLKQPLTAGELTSEKLDRQDQIIHGFSHHFNNPNDQQTGQIAKAIFSRQALDGFVQSDIEQSLNRRHTFASQVFFGINGNGKYDENIAEISQTINYKNFGYEKTDGSFRIFGKQNLSKGFVIDGRGTEQDGFGAKGECRGDGIIKKMIGFLCANKDKNLRDFFDDPVSTEETSEYKAFLQGNIIINDDDNSDYGGQPYNGDNGTNDGPGINQSIFAY